MNIEGKLKEMKKTLELAEVIDLGGYGKGLPLWLPYGLKIAERINDLFIAHLQKKLDFEIIDHPNLIPLEEYSSLFDKVGFENVYVLEGEKKYVLRPDTLQFNFEYILQKDINAALSISSGFRVETGITVPLFRDRHIWPFIQFNSMCDNTDLENLLQKNVSALAELFEDMCFPYFFVDSGKKRNYAGNQINGMTFMESGELTIISMTYVLSNLFSEHFGVPNKKMIDSGYTEKLVGMLAILHRDENGLILPSKIAPYNIVCFSREGNIHPDIKEMLNSTSFRIYYDEQEDKIKRKFKRWIRKGTNIILLCENDKIVKVVKRYNDSSEEFKNVGRFEQILKENDDFLKNRCIHLIESLSDRSKEPYIASLCDGCAENKKVFGRIYPEKKEKCEFCGKEGVKYLVTNVSRIY